MKPGTTCMAGSAWKQYLVVRLQVHDPDPSNPAHRVVECTGTLEQVRTAEALNWQLQVALQILSAADFALTCTKCV